MDGPSFGGLHGVTTAVGKNEALTTLRFETVIKVGRQLNISNLLGPRWELVRLYWNVLGCCTE